MPPRQSILTRIMSRLGYVPAHEVDDWRTVANETRLFADELKSLLQQEWTCS
jgi:hypothetical protein